MRKRFAAFAARSDKDVLALWKTAYFTFDANVLLELYANPPSVLSTFTGILERLTGRLFVTHQAALEFYRNREKVVRTARNTFARLESEFKEVPMAFSESARQQFNDLIESEKKELKKFLSDDPVERDLDRILGEHLLEPLDNTVAMYPEIDLRYAAGVPPGFADKDEKEDYRKYGDALLWFEVIRHAKANKKPHVLVTADMKHDWWRKDNKQQIIGPRPELGQELWERAAVEFHLCTFKEFIEISSTRLEFSATEAVEALEKSEQHRAEDKQKEQVIKDIVTRAVLNSPPPRLHDPIMFTPSQARGYLDQWNDSSAAREYQNLDLLKKIMDESRPLSSYLDQWNESAAAREYAAHFRNTIDESESYASKLWEGSRALEAALNQQKLAEEMYKQAKPASPDSILREILGSPRTNASSAQSSERPEVTQPATNQLSGSSTEAKASDSSKSTPSRPSPKTPRKT